ncbi:MAG: sugar phosphate nucleotidyltransferase [Phycisphaerales bacterium]
MKRVVSAILGGGRGTRLWPLTAGRAKPAVPVGGKFRLIDIPISNSLHAGIDKIYVLTQYLSASLHRHISQAYRFDSFSQGYVNILAAEQRLDDERWYQGTADAIRQNIERLIESDPTEVLILSGDQLYLMDLRGFVQQHRDAEADLTVAVKPVPVSEAPELGIMAIAGDGQIVEFVEKPKDPAVIARFQLDAATIERLGLNCEPGMVLASMGIYTFRTGVLKELLSGNERVDFGREIIPEAITRKRVHAFVEPGYWRDIGTIRSFHEANIELTAPTPELNLYDPDRPIYTRPRFLPGCRVRDCRVERSILCDGSVVSGERIADSIMGVRAVVAPEAVVDRTVFMGATYVDGERDVDSTVPLGIGPRTLIRNAIVDFDVRIGPDCRITNERGVDDEDAPTHVIRDGIVVIPRGTTVPAGTVI